MKRGDRDDVRMKLEEAKARQAVLEHVLTNGGDETGADLTLDVALREGLLLAVREAGEDLGVVTAWVENAARAEAAE